MADSGSKLSKKVQDLAYRLTDRSHTFPLEKIQQLRLPEHRRAIILEVHLHEVSEGIRTADLEAAHDTFQAFCVEINMFHDQVRDLLQAMLDGLKDRSFQSFEENLHVATLVQESANRIRHLFVCPTCGKPGRLRCRKPGRSKTGVFQIDHSNDGKKTSHGGSNKFPPLTLVPAQTKPPKPSKE